MYFSLNNNMDESSLVEEALGMNYVESWKISMDGEMTSLKKNDT